jgi:soluble lytic murein transglycosylase-like protein
VFGLRSSRYLLLALVCAAAVAVPARALERVNLSTGFSYDCLRHEPVEDGHVRLYLYSAGANEDAENFVLIPATQIVSVEALPDPPKAVVTPVVLAASAPATADVHELLAKAGAQHHVDVDLLASVIKAESGGNSHAVSRTGAQGLMQLMPGTARDMGVNDAFKPEQNIAGGTSYLDALLTKYKNDLSLALAAYNAGPAAVDKYHGVPPYRETRAYVARVENEFIRRKRAAAQTTTRAVATAVLP